MGRKGMTLYGYITYKFIRPLYNFIKKETLFHYRGWWDTIHIITNWIILFTRCIFLCIDIIILIKEFDMVKKMFTYRISSVH